MTGGASLMTTNLPKRMPVFTSSRHGDSRCLTHPHDSECPERRFPRSTAITCPQSHRQLNIRLVLPDAVTDLLASETIVSCPYLSPGTTSTRLICAFLKWRDRRAVESMASAERADIPPWVAYLVVAMLSMDIISNPCGVRNCDIGF